MSFGGRVGGMPARPLDHQLQLGFSGDRAGKCHNTSYRVTRATCFSLEKLGVWSCGWKMFYIPTT